jgi:hypothetical protein
MHLVDSPQNMCRQVSFLSDFQIVLGMMSRLTLKIVLVQRFHAAM